MSRIKSITIDQIRFLNWLLINEYDLNLKPNGLQLNHADMKAYIKQILISKKYHDVNSRYLNMLGERYKDAYKININSRYENH